VYLGCLARRSLVMRNVREVVDAAGGKPILFFPARHDTGWSRRATGGPRTWPA
jgi:nicotinic acid phosphoribosyltransferase